MVEQIIAAAVTAIYLGKPYGTGSGNKWMNANNLYRVQNGSSRVSSSGPYKQYDV